MLYASFEDNMKEPLTIRIITNANISEVTLDQKRIFL